jgi:hypothetical protein
MHTLKAIALFVGLLKALGILYEAIRFINEHFTPSSTPLKKKYPAKDPTKRPWALITGSSDGIGAEYAY